jgi:hypothetical protein
MRPRSRRSSSSSSGSAQLPWPSLRAKRPLDRADVVVERGDHTQPWCACPQDNRTYDLRNFSSTGSFGEEDNLSIGNDCAAVGVVSVGGRVTDTIPHSLTWGEVKSHYDTSGLRLEGKSWLGCAASPSRTSRTDSGPGCLMAPRRTTRLRFFRVRIWTGSSSSPPKLPWSSGVALGANRIVLGAWPVPAKREPSLGGLMYVAYDNSVIHRADRIVQDDEPGSSRAISLEGDVRDAGPRGGGGSPPRS